MKKTIALLFLFLLLPCARPDCARANQAEDEVFSFGTSLLREGDYYRAITEFKRYLHLAPDGTQASEAALGIGQSYLAAKRWEQADEALRRVADRYPQSVQAQKASLLRAEAPYRRGDYAESLLRLRQLPRNPSVSLYRTRAQYLRVWCHLELDHVDEALKELRPFSDETSEAFSNEIPLLKDLPRKSPELAGAFSALLPGAGQLYVGRPRDAALSLSLNAAFVLAILESFDDGNTFIGGILLFFEAGWYSGNIFNAVNGAHKYNRDVREKRLSDLRERFGLGVGFEEDQARLRLELRF